jgi:hypothetical protein
MIAVVTSSLALSVSPAPEIGLLMRKVLLRLKPLLFATLNTRPDIYCPQ